MGRIQVTGKTSNLCYEVFLHTTDVICSLLPAVCSWLFLPRLLFSSACTRSKLFQDRHTRHRCICISPLDMPALLRFDVMTYFVFQHFARAR